MRVLGTAGDGGMERLPHSHTAPAAGPLRPLPGTPLPGAPPPAAIGAGTTTTARRLRSHMRGAAVLYARRSAMARAARRPVPLVVPLVARVAMAPPPGGVMVQSP